MLQNISWALVRIRCQTCYLSLDHLGARRLVTEMRGLLGFQQAATSGAWLERVWRSPKRQAP